ncbi:hypothetical protein [Phormidium nigroviride]
MNVMIKIGNDDRYFDSIIRAIGLDGCDRLNGCRLRKREDD